MNDEFTLNARDKIIKFKDSTRPMEVFQGPLEPYQRTIIHRLAQQQGLYHNSTGLDSSSSSSNAKSVQIYKEDPAEMINSQASQIEPVNNRSAALWRSQTTETLYGGTRAQMSNANLAAQTLHNGSLRNAKSSNDLKMPHARSSAAPFPTSLTATANEVRRAGNFMMTSSSSSLRGPLSSSELRPQASYDELSSRFSGMNMTSQNHLSSGPRLDTGILGSTAGPIGSHRNVSSTLGSNSDQRSQRLTRPVVESRLAPLMDEQTSPGHHSQHGSRDIDDSQDSDSIDTPAFRTKGFGKYARS